MSVVGNNRVGIPIVLLHDAEGAVVTVETKNGQLIRGMLFEAEDMMNLYLKNAIITSPQGVKRKVSQVYVRGPEIIFVTLPDMLQHAPMFQRYVCVYMLFVVSLLLGEQCTFDVRRFSLFLTQNQTLEKVWWSATGRCGCSGWTSGCHFTKSQ